MNFSVTTFLFEILNFLVLLWLLHRFLYKPLLAVIDRRKAAIEQRLAEAHKVREEAAALEQRYQRQLSDFEREHNDARLKLEEELQAERTKQLAQLRLELSQERERNRLLDSQRDQERALEAEKASLEVAGLYLKRLLARIAGPELDPKFVTAALEDIRLLSGDRRQSVSQAFQDHDGVVKVETAYPLGSTYRQDMVTALSDVSGHPVHCDFVETPELLAGLRVTAGHFVLSANLLEELKFFEDAARESRTRSKAT